MPTTITALNLQEGLARPDRMLGVIERIKRLGSDVFVLTDAFSILNPKHNANEDILGFALEVLNKEGYEFNSAEYEDDPPFHVDRHLVILSRLAIKQSGQIRLANRNGLAASLVDQAQELTIIAVHLDDRSEANRQLQTQAVIEHVQFSQPTIIGGDFNSALNHSFVRNLAATSMTRSAAKFLPKPGLRSAIERGSTMASGETMKIFYRAGLKEADPDRQATFPAILPLLQLDHILTTPQVNVVDFKRDVEWPHPSDHLAITASVTVRD